MKHYRAPKKFVLRQPASHYHPGNLTTDAAFKHDEPPPMSERVVTTSERPTLYDAEGRPLYRGAGFVK